jgi:cyanophycinase-like exopeptidase
MDGRREPAENTIELMAGRIPRLLVLIGSGETAAQMTRGHRMIAGMLAVDGRKPADIRATVIDTPYGFQSNADSLTEGLVDFFGRRVGMNTTVSSFRRADDNVLAKEAAFAQIREAKFVFAGPGSPSYALRQWSGSPIPAFFAEKLRDGGALVLASAAALTVGRVTVPVYEIYKAGEDPYWLPGLDVLSTIGINAAVIPHYDNHEGGAHDTRFCFLGEQKLLRLEEQLPDNTYILGIDEHTALMVDIDAERAFVHGRGGVTIRRHGDSRMVAAGEGIALSELASTPLSPAANEQPAEPVVAGPDSNDGSLARRILELESRLDAVGKRAAMVEPLVQELIELRSTARSSGDYATADAIRDRLVDLGVEIVDSPDGCSDYHLP